MRPPNSTRVTLCLILVLGSFMVLDASITGINTPPLDHWETAELEDGNKISYLQWESETILKLPDAWTPHLLGVHCFALFGFVFVLMDYLIKVDEALKATEEAAR